MSGLSPAGLSIIGLLTALLGAWAGLSVFVGPSFGWSPDGSPSWHWNLIHAALHVAPGGVAMIAGIAMVATVPKAARGMGRLGAALAGLLAILAGAWLVVGPSEWLVLKPTPADRVQRPRHRCAASPTSSAPTWDRAFFSRSLGRSPSPGRCG